MENANYFITNIVEVTRWCNKGDLYVFSVGDLPHAHRLNPPPDSHRASADTNPATPSPRHRGNHELVSPQQHHVHVETKPGHQDPMFQFQVRRWEMVLIFCCLLFILIWSKPKISSQWEQTASPGRAPVPRFILNRPLWRDISLKPMLSSHKSGPLMQLSFTFRD